MDPLSNSFFAKDSTKAWEIINETFIRGNHERAMFKGHSQYIYDCDLFVDNPYMDPQIDIFKYFHYSMNKWIQLVKNYLDIPTLKELKSKVQTKGDFTVAYNFTNNHDNGKNCLLSLVCSRRLDKSLYLTLFLRASEITKRLLIDLVFFQRLGEYLFNGEKFKLVIHFNYLFQDDPVLLMYTVHKSKILKSIKKELKLLPRESPKRIRYKYLLDTYNQLKGVKKLEEIKYKIYRRILKVVNPQIDTAKVKPLLVKDLVLDKYLNES